MRDYMDREDTDYGTINLFYVWVDKGSEQHRRYRIGIITKGKFFGVGEHGILPDDLEVIARICRYGF